MIDRLVRAALAVACAAALLSGCAPSPAATPTPTPRFTSEAQAFAAAEATYRAYVDALNEVDLQNPATFEEVYRWTTGDALGGEKKSLTGMAAKGWVMRGTTTIGQPSVMTFTPKASPIIEIHSCMNVSAVEVTDSSGASVVGADRPSQQSLAITFESSSATHTGLKIATITGSDRPC